MYGSKALKSIVHWSSCKEVKSLIMRHLDVMEVPAGISICRNFCKEVFQAERYLRSIDYVPKWKRGGTSDLRFKYMYSDCTTEGWNVSKVLFTPTEELKMVYQVLVQRLTQYYSVVYTTATFIFQSATEMSLLMWPPPPVTIQRVCIRQ